MTQQLFLAVDHETTGFAKGGAAMQEGQARMCQTAFILFDEQGNSVFEFVGLIRPEGWTIGGRLPPVFVLLALPPS